VGSGNDLVAETFEAVDDMRPHDVVILDAQDGFRSAAQFVIFSRRGIARRKHIRGLDVGLRQIDTETGPLPLLAIDHDGAAGLFGKSEYHAQSKPGAGAEPLAVKVRRENPVAVGRLKEGAAVVG